MEAERVIATLPCEPCEGTGWCLEFHVPDGHAFQVQCTEDRIEERVNYVADELRRAKSQAADYARPLYVELYAYFMAIIEQGTYVSMPCQWCKGTGWAERYVQILGTEGACHAN